MKKKIIIGLGIFSLLFLLGGIYIITTIETATSKLDNLVKLHQIELLREHLLIQIKRVQSDLHLKSTRYARGIDTVITHVRNLDTMIDSCFQCHHSEDVLDMLTNVRLNIQDYKYSLSRIFTISANTSRLEAEEDRAFKTGEQLRIKVEDMIRMATINLEKKTQIALKNISNTKTILYILVTIGPFLAAGLGFIFIKSLTKPINVLLKATRRLKSGDLDHRINNLTDEFGEVAASFNKMSDSLKYSMHTIKESEERYTDASKAAKLGHWERDLVNQREFWSKEMYNIFGTDPNTFEPTFDNFIRLIHPDDRQSIVDSFNHSILSRESRSIEARIIRPDGKERIVESKALYKSDGNKEATLIVGTIQDITERKRNEEALLRSHIMFTTVLDSIDTIIYVSDIDTDEILYMNYQAKDVLGDLEGKIRKHVFQNFCSNDKIITPERQPRPEICICEFHDTDHNRWYEIRVRAIEWMDGRIVRMEIAHDFTERKKMEANLRRAEQMRLVGEWAAGLAHEIKNSLAGIKISVEVLSEEQGLTEEDRATVMKAINEIKRIEFLLKSLLNFARPPELHFTVTDVNTVLDHTIDFSLKQLPATSKDTTRITVQRDFDKNLPETMCDALQVKQVFMNILLNARDAMEEGGTLDARTLYIKEDNTILVEISDTGKGISEKIIKKIFSPFFTTKSKGTGLGLAITKRIITQHDGTVQAENRPGGGALFSIVIPVKMPPGYKAL